MYGFRTWAPRPTLMVLGVVMATTAAAIGHDVARGSEPAAELTEVPLMAAMFVAMVWHARRKLTAEQESRRFGEENARLLATQRRFLQDASHQLRTPITIALGHAELLAGGLTGNQETHDIEVVLGELNRLRRIAERLLVIAAAEGPEFLQTEAVELDGFTMEILRRWQPTADRRWQLGRLDKVTVQADRERLGLAVDALLENAVRHTASGDVIKLSVVAVGYGLPVRLIVADTGQGIPADLLRHVFDRFRSGDSGSSRGTGLGLALVSAVARAHGGDVLAQSTPGQGSEFELLLPAPAGPLELMPAPGRHRGRPPRRAPPMADWHASPDGAACRTGRGAGPGSTTEKVKRGMGQLTWRSAAREVGQAALRHKVLSAVIAVCVAGSLIAIGVIGSASGQPARPATMAAPAFSLPLLGDDSGQQVTLSKYRGQPLIVNFFASWCGPCKTETPLLARFYRGEKGKIALVGLDENDTVANATAFTRANSVSYPVGWDPHFGVGTAYGVSALPQTFFLNARHQIVDRIFGKVTLASLHKGMALATAGG